MGLCCKLADLDRFCKTWVGMSCYLLSIMGPDIRCCSPPPSPPPPLSLNTIITSRESSIFIGLLGKNIRELECKVSVCSNLYNFFFIRQKHEMERTGFFFFFFFFFFSHLLLSIKLHFWRCILNYIAGSEQYCHISKNLKNDFFCFPLISRIKSSLQM